jgi:hypothetical protein
MVWHTRVRTRVLVVPFWYHGTRVLVVPFWYLPKGYILALHFRDNVHA